MDRVAQLVAIDERTKRQAFLWMVLEVLRFQEKPELDRRLWPDVYQGA